MRRAAPLFAMAVAAGPVGAQTDTIDGDWAFGNPDACVLAAGNADAALRLRAGVAVYGDTECRLANPVEVRGMTAVLYDMECAGGGDTWSYRALFMLDDDGKLVMLTGSEQRVLPRCTAEAQAAPQTPPAEPIPPEALPDAAAPAASE